MDKKCRLRCNVDYLKADIQNGRGKTVSESSKPKTYDRNRGICKVRESLLAGKALDFW